MPVLQRRALGTSKTTLASGKSSVITATLVRGRVYIYKNEKFELNEERVVSKELADILEDIVVETKDTDGENFAKPMFHIKRNVSAPEKRDNPDAPRAVTRLPVRLYRPRA